MGERRRAVGGVLNLAWPMAYSESWNLTDGQVLATVRFIFIPILQIRKAEVGARLAQGHHGSGPLPIPLLFIGFSLEFMLLEPSLQDETAPVVPIRRKGGEHVGSGPLPLEMLVCPEEWIILD